MLVGAVTVLAAPPAVAVNLDQCRNGGLVAPPGIQTVTDCTGGGSGNSGWVNGNAGASNAHYAEGESISYRARLTNLTAGDQVNLIMAYDVIHSGRHAIDYLTSDDRWQQPEVAVGTHLDNPCSTVSGCSGTPTPITITAPTTNIHADPSKTLANGCETTNGSGPLQPVTSFNGVPSAERVMELFGGSNGTFSYVGNVPNLLDHNGTQQQQVQVTFTATSANPVLAWGGHIARAVDWGCLNAPQSASGISGSPYHMAISSAKVNNKDVNLGNQDRSLSAAAVIVSAPTLPTTPTGDGGAIGTILNDTATITGGNSPTGTVTFNLYGPNDLTCAGAAIYTQTVAVSGGSATTSPGFTTVAAGTYEWTAHYSGDNSNLPADSACGAEAVTIAKANPTLPTTQSAGGAIGTILNDTATVTGGSSPTGSVDFALYGPDDASCAGTAVYTQTVSLSGGTATTSPGYTTLAAGTYEWTAHYGGDDNNNAADSACGAESVVIGKNSPGASTAQDLIPNDTLTLSGATSDAGGTVDFYLFFDDQTCDVTNIDNAVFSAEDVALVTNNHASTNNSGAGAYHATDEGTYTWLAIYSGDGNNDPATSDCVEQFTIDNDITP